MTSNMFLGTLRRGTGWGMFGAMDTLGPNWGRKFNGA